MKYRERVARDIEKREGKWRRSWDEKARAAIDNGAAQVTITIEGGMGDLIVGPATTTASRFEHAVRWFAARGYELTHHTQGAGLHAWVATFKKTEDA